MDFGLLLRAGGVLEAVRLGFAGESREGWGVHGVQRKLAAWARRNILARQNWLENLGCCECQLRKVNASLRDSSTL